MIAGAGGENPKVLAQFMKFGLTGVINTLIDFSVFNLMLYITRVENGIALLAINLLAVMVAAVNSYFMNRRYTFQSDSHPYQIQKFVVATLCGMAVNSLGVMVFSHLVSFIPWPAVTTLNLGKLAGAILSTVWNFTLYRAWVFKRSCSSELEFPTVIPGLTSIIIPAYNESHRLPRRLDALAEALCDRFPLEILVVDDGSTDNTANLACSIASRHPYIHCHSYQPNQGKGQAVKTGMLKARGEYLIFADADDSFSPEHIEMLAQNLQEGAPVVIACREMREGKRSQGESGVRRMMGRIFNGLVQGLLLPGLPDTQCGLKGFQSSIAQRIFPLQRTKGFAFDVEVLALTRSLNYEISQLPVYIADCSGSRVNRWLDPLRMLRDIGRVKIALITNSYGLGGKKPFPASLAWGSALFAAALALRLPWLWEFPRFIDELKEVDLAYQIYLGQAHPLHNAAHDIGAMHNYLLAGLFRLLGPGIYWPRLYVACVSALGVVLVYHLGKQLYGKYAGLLAAIFLLFNGMHILNSHMAWANCTTPAFFTAALLALVAAEKRGSGKYLMLSGLLWAATLQTHASVIIYVSVIAIYIMSPGFRRRSNIARPWYLGSISVFLLGYSNMIYYNLASRGGSIRWLNTKSYALEQHPGFYSYGANLEQMTTELLRTLSSSYTQHNHLWQYLSHPGFTLALLLLLYGAYLSLRRQDIRALPAWLLLAALLIMPAINERYVFYLATRYIMPAVICALLLMAQAVQQLGLGIPRMKLPKALPALSAGLLIILALQYLPYARYCMSNLDTNASNRLALQVVAAAQTMSSPTDTLVLIDQSLPLENHPLPYLLNLTSQHYREIPITGTAFSGNNRYWAKQLRQYRPGTHLIAIISDKSYLSMADHITPQQKARFSSRVVLPTTRRQPRNVYVLQWDVTRPLGK